MKTRFCTGYLLLNLAMSMSCLAAQDAGVSRCNRHEVRYLLQRGAWVRSDAEGAPLALILAQDGNFMLFGAAQLAGLWWRLESDGVRLTTRHARTLPSETVYSISRINATGMLLSGTGDLAGRYNQQMSSTIVSRQGMAENILATRDLSKIIRAKSDAGNDLQGYVYRGQMRIVEETDRILGVRREYYSLGTSGELFLLREFRPDATVERAAGGNGFARIRETGSQYWNDIERLDSYRLFTQHADLWSTLKSVWCEQGCPQAPQPRPDPEKVGPPAQTDVYQLTQWILDNQDVDIVGTITFAADESGSYGGSAGVNAYSGTYFSEPPADWWTLGAGMTMAASTDRNLMQQEDLYRSTLPRIAHISYQDDSLTLENCDRSVQLVFQRMAAAPAYPFTPGMNREN